MIEYRSSIIVFKRRVAILLDLFSHLEQ